MCGRLGGVGGGSASKAGVSLCVGVESAELVKVSGAAGLSGTDAVWRACSACCRSGWTASTAHVLDPNVMPWRHMSLPPCLLCSRQVAVSTDSELGAIYSGVPPPPAPAAVMLLLDATFAAVVMQ